MARASDLARGLGAHAEAVCRHYLSNGRRQGRYWTVGDVRNTPGRSMFVRLSGPDAGPGAAGRWTDAATAEFGDLLDVIRESCGFTEFRDVADEARRFLALPRAEPRRNPKPVRTPVPAGSPEAARRLFAASKPVRGTLAECWFRQRGILLPADTSALRFHPRCYYRGAAGRETWPALIAAVTDRGGAVTGVHRTWLHPGGGKAPVGQPRRALGNLAGNAVRFGRTSDVLTAAEGIETALALKTVMPAMPVAAALSAAHLAALIMPSALRRIYVAIDKDAAGAFALERLRSRGRRIEICPLVPRTEDFNADLLTLGPARFRAWLAGQLAPGDAERFAS